MRLSACLLACLFLPALPAAAAQVPGLYEVREPVASQDEAERARGMSHALQMLAVRLTGNPASATDRRLQPLLGGAQQMVQQYLYEEGQPLNLVVTFNAAQATQALSAAGLVLWNPDRPQLLAWWMTEEADGRHLVADGDRASTLQAAAQSGGLPLLLPMGDLGEQMLDARALLAADPGVLRAASERYAVDVRLAVVEQNANGQRKADWVLWLGDNAERGTVTAADSAAVATAVMQAVAQKMSGRFVASGNAAQLDAVRAVVELLLEVAPAVELPALPRGPG